MESLCNFQRFNNHYSLSPREGNGTPLQYSCLENPMDRGAWWAAVHGVAKSPTRLNDFHFSLSCIGEGYGNPVQCSCLENPRYRGAWWGAVYGVAQNRTRLNDLAAFPFSKMYLKFCDRCSVEEIQGITNNVVPCRGHQNISSLAKMMQNTFA